MIIKCKVSCRRLHNQHVHYMKEMSGSILGVGGEGGEGGVYILGVESIECVGD